MHRYEELEKLYYRKKIKKYLLIFLTLIAVIGIGAVLYSVNKNVKHKKFEYKPAVLDNNSSKEIKEENKSVQTFSKVKKEDKKPEKKERNETKIQKNVKNEGLTFSFYVPKIKEKPESFKEENRTHRPQPKEKKRVQKPEKKTVKTVSIEESSIDINKIIKEFNKQPRFDLAILISKYYYNKKDFSNAKLWALKANNIDPSNYQSWKMFALILLKKNDKIKAKEVLKIYLDDYGENTEIEKLLRSIDE